MKQMREAILEKEILFLFHHVITKTGEAFQGSIL